MTDDGQRLAALAADAAVAAERARIAKLLHDELVQLVSVASLRVELLRPATDAEADDVREAQEAMRLATQHLRAVMAELRGPAAGT